MLCLPEDLASLCEQGHVKACLFVDYWVPTFGLVILSQLTLGLQGTLTAHSTTTHTIRSRSYPSMTEGTEIQSNFPRVTQHISIKAGNRIPMFWMTVQCLVSWEIPNWKKFTEFYIFHTYFRWAEIFHSNYWKHNLDGIDYNFYTRRDACFWEHWPQWKDRTVQGLLHNRFHNGSQNTDTETIWYPIPYVSWNKILRISDYRIDEYKLFHFEVLIILGNSYVTGNKKSTIFKAERSGTWDPKNLTHSNLKYMGS